jgi:hypothetical protein
MKIILIEIVTLPSTKTIEKVEGKTEAEINTAGMTPGLIEENPEETKKGKFASLFIHNLSIVIGKLMTAEIEGAKMMDVTGATVEADLPAEITGIKIQSVAVIATWAMTESIFEIKKVIPEITLGVAITIPLKTQNR